MSEKPSNQDHDNPQTERETVEYELSLETCAECGKPNVLTSAWIPLCPTCEWWLNLQNFEGS